MRRTAKVIPFPHTIYFYTIKYESPTGSVLHCECETAVAMQALTRLFQRDKTAYRVYAETRNGSREIERSGRASFGRAA